MKTKIRTPTIASDQATIFWRELLMTSYAQKLPALLQLGKSEGGTHPDKNHSTPRRPSELASAALRGPSEALIYEGHQLGLTGLSQVLQNCESIGVPAL